MLLIYAPPIHGEIRKGTNFFNRNQCLDLYIKVTLFFATPRKAA